MLESADIRLQYLNDPSLLPIRQKLADDIQVLQQVNPVSIDSIALQIGALVKQVNPLPLAFFKKPESEQPVDVQQASGWRENLARNWQQVTQDFFSVKRKTAEIKPFMSEQEQWLAKQQLSFALLQGQVAVLREKQTLYQQFLANAIGLTQAFFDLEQTSVQQFIKQLSELQNIQINREYPDQFSAVPLLQNTIDVRLDNRFKSTPVEPASATSEAPAQGQPEPSEALGEPQEEASQL